MSQPRSSLGRHVVSGVADDQENYRRVQYERRAWLERGIVLIGVHDQSISPAVRAIAEAFGMGKFKCRPGKSCERGEN